MSAPSLPMNDRVPVGLVTVGKTTYTVYDLGVGENSAKAGVRVNLALIGPRGASYFVTDFGPKYHINSIACGGARPWAPSPRSLRGLTREHLAAFLAR